MKNQYDQLHDQTQECIALEMPLSADMQKHLQACNFCRQLEEAYKTLKMLMVESEVEVPRGFVDRVMNKIESDSFAVAESDFFQKAVGSMEGFFALPAAQYLALGMSVVVALANLLRFVFFVLIPN